jgi:hypothetical protein
MFKYFFYVAFLLTVLCIEVQSQSRELKFDMKYQVNNNDFTIINDSTDHKIGKATGNGSAMVKDGSSAEVKVYFIYDYVKGNGEFIEYYYMTFQDGSTLTIRAKGRSFGSTDESMPLFNAQVQITGGTGTYANISGSGSFSGNRKDALENGAIVKLSFNITTK